MDERPAGIVPPACRGRGSGRQRSGDRGV